MKRKGIIVKLALMVGVIGLVVSGCSTLSVSIPRGMYVSTGDYSEGVRTVGIMQAKTSVIAPLAIVDINKVHERLYKKIIEKADSSGYDGLTNLQIYWKPSPWSYLTIFVATVVLDFYVEGVVIDERL